jgi:GTP cyclohydrolase I
MPIPIPHRRVLPPLFASNSEYERLEELAAAKSTTVAELLKEVVSVLGDRDWRPIILQIPQSIYDTYSEFFPGYEEAERAIERAVEVDAEFYDRALKIANAEGKGEG